MNTRSNARGSNTTQMQKLSTIVRRHIINITHSRIEKNKIKYLRNMFCLFCNNFDIFICKSPYFTSNLYKKGYEFIEQILGLSNLSNTNSAIYAMKKIHFFQQKYKDYYHEINIILLTKKVVPDLLRTIHSFLH